MITLTLLVVLIVVCAVLGLCFHLIGGVLGIGFHVVGGVLKLVFKLLFCLPCAFVLAIVGIVLCCTLILIPLGIVSFKLAGALLNPLKFCFVH